MATRGTPRATYPWRPSAKQLKKSYEVRLAAQFGNDRAKEKLAAYNRQVKERKMEANMTEWEIDGRKFNRYKMMDFLVTRIANGESLPQVCGDPGMPSMLLVYSWFDNHPEFSKAMQRAEEVRGHLLGEQALLVATGTDRVNVSADKLKFEALSKAAARSNIRYQDKQVVQQQDEYANMTEEQVRQRIIRMVEANPALAEVVAKHPSLPEIGLLDVSSETLPDGLDQTGTHDEGSSEQTQEETLDRFDGLE